MTQLLEHQARPIADEPGGRSGRGGRGSRTVARRAAGRVLLAVFAIWAAYTVTFLILYVLPSDPVSVMLNIDGDGTYVDPEHVAALQRELGLDRPLHEQYLTQLGRVLRGDLGASIQTGRPVLGSVLAAAPATLALTAAALLIAVLSGTLVAVTASVTRWRWMSATLRALPPLGSAVPVFWAGLMLLQLLSFRLPLFPSVGGSGLHAVVLPAITLAIPASAQIAQVLLRNSEHIAAEPFMDVVRASGASRSRAYLTHVIKNAALPTFTVLGLTVGGMLSGAVVTETVFSRPGLGRLIQSAVSTQDIPLVQGLVLVSAVIYVGVNLMVDLAYPLLDPRVRRTGGDR